MSTIKLRGTDDMPNVTLDIENNIFEISGRSMPEDVASFYQPILDWIDNELRKYNGKIVFVFKMNYFNTASSKLLLDIMIRLEEMFSEGKDIVIYWYYDEDDEDMMEAGEEYAEIVEVPFEIKSNG